MNPVTFERTDRVRYPVYIVSNDVVPDMGMTVSAPGLRSRGLASGLRHHGFQVTEIVPEGPVSDRWQGEIPPPRPPGVVMLAGAEISGFLAQRAPAVVIVINSNQVAPIPEMEDLALIVDLFAPRILEVACQSDHYPQAEIAAMRTRDILAMRRGDSFIVNGPKKIPFYLAWLLQTDRNPQTVRMDVVPMPMACNFDDGAEAALGDAADQDIRPIQVVSAGYLQGWSRPGPWYQVVADVVGQHNGEFHVAVVPRTNDGDGLDGSTDDLGHFDHPAVVTHQGMLYDDYRRFMRSKDMAVDLFAYTIERPYAMVTRTVGALASGLPVVHVPWTETAAYIKEYDAGWLVDPGNSTRLENVLVEALGDHDCRRQKALNARRLWREVFDPVVATEPLVDQVWALCRRLAEQATEREGSDAGLTAATAGGAA